MTDMPSQTEVLITCQGQKCRINMGHLMPFDGAPCILCGPTALPEEWNGPHDLLHHATGRGVTPTPPPERREAEIAEIVALFQHHGSRVKRGQHIGTLHEAGWFITESDLPYLVRDGLHLVGGEAPQHGGRPMTMREIMEDESPAAPAVDEELEMLMYDLRRSQDDDAVSFAAQAIRDYVARHRGEG